MQRGRQIERIAGDFCALLVGNHVFHAPLLTACSG